MDISLSVRNLNLDYRVYQYRSTSFKEYVMNRLMRKNSYQLIKALSNINFDVQKGESVALIGHNGSGKSTLLKCIAGIYQPPGADIVVHGRTAPMIELGAGFDSELSGRENIRLSCMLMGLTHEEIDQRMEKIIDFSEIRGFIDIPFKNYSSGMQTRLGFACATAVDPDVLLVDEVLAVGDSNFARKCLDRVNALKKKGTTVILVSHDFATMRAFCSRGIVLDMGVPQFDGPIEEALACQDEIMDRRYLENLPADERAEVLRLRALKKDAETKKVANQPEISVYTELIQNDLPTESLDVNRKFELRFRLTAKKPEFFEGDVSVGFGLNCVNGVRVGGYNNIKHGVKVSKTEFQSNKSLECTFVFDDGIPNLATGNYKIYCGVHDRGIQRTLLVSEVLTIKAVNNDAKVNLDGDVLDFGRIVSRLEVKAAL